jgi:hypothetical protein
MMKDWRGEVDIVCYTSSSNTGISDRATTSVRHQQQALQQSAMGSAGINNWLCRHQQSAPQATALRYAGISNGLCRHQQ